MTTDVGALPLIDPALQKMRLADGRTLTWQEFGDPAGRPVLYFHGGGSMSDEGAIFHKEAVVNGVRLIATNRPGARGSTPAPGRPVAVYSDDLRELLDHLGIEGVACFGESNGGMVTLAVAATMADRVMGGVPINPTVPWHDPIARGVSARSVAWAYWTMRYAPWVLQLMATRGVGLGGGTRREFERVTRGRSLGLFGPPPGTEPDIAEAMRGMQSKREPQSLIPELRWAASDWGFDHYAIPVRLDFYCGVHDAQAPFALVAADANPNAAFHYFRYGHRGYAHPDARRRIVETVAGYWS